MDLEDFEHGLRYTSIAVPHNLWVMAKQNLIELKRASIFGIKFALAEKDLMDYPENSLSAKVKRLTALLDEKSKELDDLKNPTAKKVDPDIVAEVDKILEDAVDGIN